MSLIKYRPDIDGLRAIAVLSVLFFHLEASYLPGGFLGVDIFFVISGYLITKIILVEKQEKRFSYSSFYERRAKRILPPLFFVLFLTSFASAIILLPYDFFKFGVSLASVLVFASNIQFALRTGDYFSGDSAEWPLLHTWSLAVEEQYYFLLPLLISLCFLLKKDRTILIFLVLAIVSFITAELMSRSAQYSSSSYYLIITRMGELLVGSILAAYQIKGSKRLWESQIYTLLSFLVIVLMLLLVDKNTVFPGLIAVPLCVSVAIIINSSNTYINRLLAIPVFVKVGLISYSLYLVHWPVFALSRYLLNIENNNFVFDYQTQAVLLGLVFFLSFISYQFVEQPLRKLTMSKKMVFWCYFIFPSLVLAVLSSLIILNKGMPSRFSSSTVSAELQYSHINKSECPSLVNLGCTSGDESSEKRVIVFGNSHAEHYFEYVSILANDFNHKTKLYAAGGCTLIKKDSKCLAVLEAFEAAIKPNDIIVISYRWDHTYLKENTLNELNGLVQSLVSSRHRVVLLAQPPVLSVNPSKIANCSRLEIDCEFSLDFKNSYLEYNQVIKDLALNAGARFVDPYEGLDNPYQIKNEDYTFYSDFDHLSVYGARWLSDNRTPEIEKQIFGD